MTDAGALLACRDLTFSYNSRFNALEGINLDVPPGAFLGIVGPNGSGKTTLLRLLGGLVRPTAGSVLLAGADLHRMPARDRARRIAFLPQQVSPNFNYTARQVVAMGRFPHLGTLGLESAHDWSVIDEALALTEATEFADRSILELSGGERQRVLIASALAQSDELVLLDEPTASLDLKHEIGIYQLLSDLNRERNTSVLTVTHNLSLAGQFAREIILLDRGRVVAQGPPERVLDPELVEKVYHLRVHRLTHPDDGSTVLLPARPRGGRQ